MLKQRIITACALAAVVLTAVLLAPPSVFAVLFLIVVGFAAWEWSNLSHISALWARAAYVAVVLVTAGISAWLVTKLGRAFLFDSLLVACGWWALCLLWVQSYPASGVLWQSRPVRAVMGVLVLVPAWQAFVSMHSLAHGQWLVLALIGTVAAADIGAYFAGKAFGRHKLAPKVSPGKTWEGLFGGVCAAVVFLALVLHLSVAFPVLSAVGLALPTALVSVVGDLFESMLKRHRGIKDSSNLLPGHGGFLDRVDGLVAAAPVFVLALLAAGWPY